uniref:Uncharacterized protein n=1 Tax=Candidatus Kentrum sp. TC TaxID=2126339 RepID=A0A451A2P6_9GAMM|nr:MAG: hypothetical protein BECKTC1821F_GA0114240_104415 [Candidatus Kentron sp. TC]
MGNESTRAKVYNGIGFDKETRPENTVDTVSVIKLTQFDVEISRTEISNLETFDPLCKHVFETAYATDTVYFIIGCGKYIDRAEHFYLKNSPPGPRIEEDLLNGQPMATMRQIDRYKRETVGNRNLHLTVRTPSQ